MKKLIFFLVITLILSVVVVVNPSISKAETNETSSEGETSLNLNEATDAYSEEGSVISFPVVKDGTGGGDAGTFAVTGPNDTVRYPNSTIVVRVGDILISEKSWDATRFVGHAAIVGSDFVVREVLPGVAGRAVSLASHRLNQNGGVVKIYRHSNSTTASKAGIWATNNIGKVTSYWYNANLQGISPNYCSKFIYQAYMNSTGTLVGYIDKPSINGGVLTGYVLPNSLTVGTNYVGTYK